MVIKTESIAQENATKIISSKYKNCNLITYDVTLLLLKKLLDSCVITHDDYIKSIKVLSAKYGLKESSIFASNDLI